MVKNFGGLSVERALQKILQCIESEHSISAGLAKAESYIYVPGYRLALIPRDIVIHKGAFGEEEYVKSFFVSALVEGRGDKFVYEIMRVETHLGHIEPGSLKGMSLVPEELAKAKFAEAIATCADSGHAERERQRGQSRDDMDAYKARRDASKTHTCGADCGTGECRCGGNPQPKKPGVVTADDILIIVHKNG